MDGDVQEEDSEAPAQQRMSLLASPPVAMDATRGSCESSSRSSATLPAFDEVKELLNTIDGVRILQLRREIDDCSDLGNHYVVLHLQGGRELLYFRETFPMNICTMCCISGNCRGFHIEGSLVPEPVFGDGDTFQAQRILIVDRKEGDLDQAFLRLVRPTSFTFCGLGRPSAVLSELSTGQVLGFMEDPWDLWKVRTKLKEPSSEENGPLFTWDGSRWQRALCCPTIGSKLHYSIKHGSGGGNEEGQEAASVTKLYNIGDFCPTHGGDESLSSFDMNFEKGQSSQHKLLLIASSIFVHQQRFDSRGQLRGGDPPEEPIDALNS